MAGGCAGSKRGPHTRLEIAVDPHLIIREPDDLWLPTAPALRQAVWPYGVVAEMEPARLRVRPEALVHRLLVLPPAPRPRIHVQLRNQYGSIAQALPDHATTDVGGLVLR